MTSTTYATSDVHYGECALILRACILRTAGCLHGNGGVLNIQSGIAPMTHCHWSLLLSVHGVQLVPELRCV